MRARAAVTARRCGARTVLSELRGEPPIGLRPVPDGVALVGTAAGPVGGDDLGLTVRVEPGATLCVSAVAATMVWPGRAGAASGMDLAVSIGAGGTLRWVGRPLISVVGSDHHQRATFSLDGDARAEVHEEITLGRCGEPPGRLVTRLRVLRDGRPLLDHRQRVDPAAPGWATSAGAGGHRHQIHRLVVGGPVPDPTVIRTESAVMARWLLADDVSITVVSAVDRAAALALVHHGEGGDRGDGRDQAPVAGGTTRNPPGPTVTSAIASDRPR